MINGSANAIKLKTIGKRQVDKCTRVDVIFCSWYKKLSTTQKSPAPGCIFILPVTDIQKRKNHSYVDIDAGPQFQKIGQINSGEIEDNWKKNNMQAHILIASEYRHCSYIFYGSFLVLGSSKALIIYVHQSVPKDSRVGICTSKFTN